MLKVFLSHSSKQKEFLNKITEYLKKKDIIYDEWCFESGGKTLDEIYNGMDESGIFVLFISNDSLNSEWVRKEILIAEDYLKKGRIKRFLPILIDKDINHNDTRIPFWISSNYNIRYIARPIKCFDLISQTLRLVKWELYPKNEELDQLFIGRNEQTKEFEERYFSTDDHKLNCVIVSGINTIGRRKYLNHILKNSNIIRKTYQIPVITLDQRNSIEDVIVKLYSLGYTNQDIDITRGLTQKNIDEKINIVKDLLIELNSNKDKLMIIDNKSIINRKGIITDWFLTLLKKLEIIDEPFIFIVNQTRVIHKQRINYKKNIITIDIPEFSPTERKGLFQSILKIKDISLKNEDINKICELFTGFPEQIDYTVSIIKEAGLEYLLSNMNEIIDYNTEKISKIIKNYDTNNLAKQVLALLSETEFISINFIEKILIDDFESAKSILTELSNELIIEYVGSTKEYIRLNDAIKDYIQRLGYKIDNKYRENLVTQVNEIINNYDVLNSDISEYLISIKESLKIRKQIPEYIMIPSHYVNAMRELYNYDKRYKEVIELADRILLNEKSIDKNLIKEIRYWLCLSLARLRDKRILEEVQKVDGDEHNFLLGFYYRIVGRHSEAIEKFNDILSNNPKHFRARKELVQVYVNSEQYNDAMKFAKEAYNYDKNNPYHMQSYLKCLLRIPAEAESNTAIIKQLLDRLKESPHENAKEMYLTSISQYYAYIQKDIASAIQKIDDAIRIFPKKIYPYLAKIDFLKRINDHSGLEQFLKQIETEFNKDSDICNRLPYLSAKCEIYIKNKEQSKAMDILENKIKPNFALKKYNELKANIDEWIKLQCQNC